MWSCKTVRSQNPLSVRMDEEGVLCYFTTVAKAGSKVGSPTR